MEHRYASALPDFDTVWDTQVIPWAREYRDRQARNRSQLTVRTVVVTILMAPGIVGIVVSEVDSRPQLLSLVWSAAILIAGLFWMNRPYNDRAGLKSNAKRHALGLFCAAARLDYDIEAKEFEVGAFCNFSFQWDRDMRFVLEDRIAGRHAGLSFELCEAIIYSMRLGENKIVRSLLLRVDSAKNFTSETYVHPVREANMINEYKTEPGGREPEMVHLEDPRFDGVFTVYSTDQVEARYLLTPTFMERLADLPEKVGGRRVECAFVDGKILVAVGVSDNQFEIGDILDDPLNHMVPHRLRNELLGIFQLIDAVRFSDNTRA